MPAPFKIGGVEYTLPKMVLGVIVRTGPKIRRMEKLQADMDKVDAARLLLVDENASAEVKGVALEVIANAPEYEDLIQATVEVLSAWMIHDHPELTVDHILNSMDAEEMEAIGPALMAGATDGGIKQTGEAKGGARKARTSPSKSKPSA